MAIALDTDDRDHSAMVLSAFFVLKRQVRDNLLRTAPGIGSPAPVRPPVLESAGTKFDPVTRSQRTGPDSREQHTSDRQPVR
jgi:hypothetical protein